ncbi:hypothetical protein C8R46DRAFT_664924 [Mycena filopes]|nr:hypothetical protein C8R46DRAFT_664924 [Mycena filopes]
MSLAEEDYAALGLTGPYRALRARLWTCTLILATFLKSPDNSPLCAASVVKTVNHIIPPDVDQYKFAIRFLRTENQISLDRLVRFIAIPRTDEQLQHLETTLNECRCDLTLPLIQLIHDDSEDIPYKLSFVGVISSIFTTLGGVVRNGLKAGHVVGPHMSTSDPGYTKKWPSTTAALFPAGPDAAVLSFARLFKRTKSLAILDFTRTLLPHCPSFATPISDCTLFWEVIVEELQVAVHNYHVPSDEEEEEDEDTPHGTIRAFTMFLQEFIATFSDGIRQKTTSSCLSSFGRQIYDLLLKVLLVAKRSPKQAKLETFCLFVASVAATVVNAVPHDQRPRRIHPVIALYGRLGNGPRAWAFTEVFAAISRLTAVVRCCSASCTETSESSAQKLRYCARCKVMRYCSNSCQRAAWRYHKNVCVDVERLNKKVMVLPFFNTSMSVYDGGAAQILDNFEREARKQGFTEDRMKEISTELTPFCHFENAGATAAPTHEDAHHY